MSFEAREATASTVHAALQTGKVSCRQIVQAFLARIEAHNHKLNAIICLNPNALHEADELDKRLETGESPGVLYGVPILLKDNFDAVGMPTTAGALALEDVWPNQDAHVVTNLRSAGAVILGKTNLHELALEGLTVSSLGGQTLNPYDFSRTPGGSSGGSGAAVAASFAVMATGSDTVNSLRSPASANCLYSIRPTQGLVSRRGVVPVSNTQDTVGMIGRCLQDVAIALSVMSNNEECNIMNFGQAGSMLSLGGYDTEILTDSSSRASRPCRIGILHGFFNYTGSPETDPVNEILQSVLSKLREEEMSLIDIQDTVTFDALAILANTDVQMYEIREQMDAYLSSPSLKGAHPRSYSEIFIDKYSPEFLVIPSQYPYIQTALTQSTSSPEYKRRKACIVDLTNSLTRTFYTNNLDAIIYPQQRNLVVPVGSSSQYGRNGILAAVTGFPVVCMPAGFSPPTESAPIGLPIGMELLGLPQTEAKLLAIADRIDKRLNARKPPVTRDLAISSEAIDWYEHVPTVKPLGLSSVDTERYPPGRR